MQFRTEIPPAPLPQRLGPGSHNLLLGSCFAEHIGQRLQQYKFKALVNPFGTVFNPISIFCLLEMVLKGQHLPPHLYLQNGELHSHYWLHSEFSASDAAQLAAQAAEAQAHTAQCLAQMAQAPQNGPHFLMLTFGTAWVYELKEGGQLVANCHKMPAHLFAKRLLAVDEITSAFGRLLPLLPPQVQVLLTLSPVRHLKDTLPLNSVSKAVLRLACHQLCEAHPGRVAYFPAYELLTDDLRDYRFYAADMLHPSPQAIDYVFEKFTASAIAPAAQNFMAQWQKISTALQHRPFRPHTQAHRKFLAQLLAQLQAIETVDVSEEIAQVRAQLAQAES